MVLEVATPTRVQQGAILMLAATLVAAGVGGGQWFMNADYVVYGFSVRPAVCSMLFCRNCTHQFVRISKTTFVYNLMNKKSLYLRTY